MGTDPPIRTNRGRRSLVLLVVVIVLAGFVIVVLTGDERTTACIADGLILEDGRVANRDPDRDCVWVDPDGKVLPPPYNP